MRSERRWFVLCLALVLGVGFFPCGQVLAEVGTDFTLIVTPDDDVDGGDTVSVVLSGANPGDIALLLTGEDTGETPFGELTLDIIPQSLFVLGPIPATGTMVLEFTMPSELPPELWDLTIYLQAVTVGPGGGLAPGLNWRKSNMDELEFDDGGQQ